jgi:hypothetical protein
VGTGTGGFYLGVDIGGTKNRVGLVDADHRVLEVARLIRYHHPLAPRIWLRCRPSTGGSVPGLLRNGHRAQRPTPR